MCVCCFNVTLGAWVQTVEGKHVLSFYLSPLCSVCVSVSWSYVVRWPGPPVICQWDGKGTTGWACCKHSRKRKPYRFPADVHMTQHVLPIEKSQCVHCWAWQDACCFIQAWWIYKKSLVKESHLRYCLGFWLFVSAGMLNPKFTLFSYHSNSCCDEWTVYNALCGIFSPGYRLLDVAQLYCRRFLSCMQRKHKGSDTSSGFVFIKPSLSISPLLFFFSIRPVINSSFLSFLLSHPPPHCLAVVMALGLMGRRWMGAH